MALRTSMTASLPALAMRPLSSKSTIFCAFSISTSVGCQLYWFLRRMFWAILRWAACFTTGVMPSSWWAWRKSSSAFCFCLRAWAVSAASMRIWALIVPVCFWACSIWLWSFTSR